MKTEKLHLPYGEPKTLDEFVMSHKPHNRGKAKRFWLDCYAKRHGNKKRKELEEKTEE